MTSYSAPAATVLGHFVAQHERPVGVQDVDLAALAPHHRCLLVTDGTVTSLVAACALEPIRTRRLEQGSRPARPEEQRWLAVPAGTALVARRVAIEGARSGTVFLRASSVLVPSRLPGHFLQSLQDDGASIGSALVAGAVEHRRELLWCHRGAGAIASRTYRVVVRDVPALLISEDVIA